MFIIYENDMSEVFIVYKIEEFALCFLGAFSTLELATETIDDTFHVEAGGHYIAIECDIDVAFKPIDGVMAFDEDGNLNFEDLNVVYEIKGDGDEADNEIVAFRPRVLSDEEGKARKTPSPVPSPPTSPKAKTMKYYPPGYTDEYGGGPAYTAVDERTSYIDNTGSITSASMRAYLESLSVFE